MFAFELTVEQIKGNFERLMDTINVILESRSENLMKMYESFGDNFIITPASSHEHFHNAIPGGYVDHVLRVMDNAIELYKVWEAAGLIVDNFTLEELVFSAIHHDLGKIGFEGNDSRRYIENTSSWHYDKMGRCYEMNDEVPFMNVADQALFMLQKYQVPVSLNETLGIKLTDGLYDPANEEYLKANKHNKKLRTNMPLILHHADMMAAQFEYDRWSVSSSNGFKKIRG